MIRHWIIIAFVFLSTSSVAAEVTLQAECEVVDVITADHDSLEMASRLAKIACRQIERLAVLSGINLKNVRIRICADMDDFRRRSGRGWYIGAVLVGTEIVTQPARSLVRMKNLEQTLAHELSHLLIATIAGRNCPRWLDEGLAQWLAGQKAGLQEIAEAEMPTSRAALKALELKFTADSASKAELRQAYRVSLALADRLISRAGLEEVLAALPGLKKTDRVLEIEIAGRKMEEWLFGKSDLSPEQ